MPCRKISGLPDRVTARLPQHAQGFLAAFHHIFEEYHHDKERAFRVARSAVERDYAKGRRRGTAQEEELTCSNLSAAGTATLFLPYFCSCLTVPPFGFSFCPVTRQPGQGNQAATTKIHIF